VIWLAAGITGIVAAELLYRIFALKIPARMAITMRKSLRTIRLEYASDHWKEKVVLHYAIALLKETGKLTLGFAIVVAVVAFLMWLASLAGLDLARFMVSWAGLIFVTAVAIVYVIGRKRFA